MIGGNGYVGATDTEKEIQDDKHDACIAALR
jgi:hypothetical protein